MPFSVGSTPPSGRCLDPNELAVVGLNWIRAARPKPQRRCIQAAAVLLSRLRSAGVHWNGIIE